jgi:HlyD family secretion protein
LIQSAFEGASRDLPQLCNGLYGRVEVARIEIATKFPGRVLDVPVQEGDMVKAGDVIAKMDTSDLEAQLVGVQAMRQRAVQAMARAQGETQVHRIQANVAQMEFNNALDLQKQVLVSDSEVKRLSARRRRRGTRRMQASSA